MSLSLPWGNLGEAELLYRSSWGRLRSWCLQLFFDNSVPACNLDCPGCAHRVGQVVYMIAHGDEEIEEHSASRLHLHLACSTTLESFPAADDERKVVSSEGRVRLWCIVIGKAHGPHDSCDLYAGAEALFSQGHLLQLLQTITVRCTIDRCIPEYGLAHSREEDCWL